MKDQKKHSPAVIWLTGLSAAGKTTIANRLVQVFIDEGIIPVLLDGDEIRKISPGIQFDEISRKQHNLKVGTIAAKLEGEGHIVIVSLIAPYEQTRKQVRQGCRNYIEVYISTSLAVCIRRDPKGLYKKALKGELKDFTGISAPYEIPVQPEIIINTETTTPDEAACRVLNYLRKRTTENPANKLKPIE
jgi:adenylylsulfate kinase